MMMFRFNCLQNKRAQTELHPFKIICIDKIKTTLFSKPNHNNHRQEPR